VVSSVKKLTKKGSSKRNLPRDVEVEADAWTRFTGAMKKVAPPKKPKPAKAPS